jgi:hypothetical protein
LAVASFGCAHHLGDHSSKDRTIYTTQVALGRCAYSSETHENPALAALASSVIEKGVNKIGAALAAAGEAKMWEAFASRNFEFNVDDDQQPDCIQIARGSFYTDPNSTDLARWHLKADEWDVPKGSQGTTDSDDDSRGDAPMNGPARGPDLAKQYISTAVLNGLWLADDPDFFFEGRLDRSGDGTALTIEPNVLAFGKPIGRRTLRPSGSRHLAIFVAITAAGAPPDLKAAPGTTLKIGRMAPGDIVYFASSEAWKALDGPWNARPSSSRPPFSSHWFAVAMPEASAPRTLHVLVTETQGESEFLKFLGSVFDESTRAAISSELKRVVIPAVDEAADLAESTARGTASNAADSKYAAALDAIAKCAGAEGGTATVAAAARVVMREANLAAVAAGRGEPFAGDKISAISIGGTPDEIRTSCSQAR